MIVGTVVGDILMEGEPLGCLEVGKVFVGAFEGIFVGFFVGDLVGVEDGLVEGI